MAAMTTLRDLFVKELRDMYDGEKQISKALPKMMKAAANEELRSAFEEHHQVTLQQIERLERAFEELDMRARGQRCHGVAGIIEEGQTLLDEDADDDVMDAGLIGAAQKVEHYEIASYGTLVTWAQTLGLDGVAELLQQTLAEEKETDQKLTQLAESMVNLQATEGEERQTAAPKARAASASRNRRS
jgi:ferritin-like metal-binding protein YciE